MGTWYSYEAFCAKYEFNGTIVNFLEYLTILQSIPKEWIKLAKLHGDPKYQTAQEKICSTPKLTKYVYNLLVAKRGILSACRSRWENKLNMELTDEYWRVITMRVFQIRNSVKLRWFQFRLLNLILTTNIDRFR